MRERTRPNIFGGGELVLPKNFRGHWRLGIITTSTTTSRKLRARRLGARKNAACHMANAKEGDVWTQFYPLLDAVSLK